LRTSRRLAEACEALGIGCIIEPMARGERADHDILPPEFIALGAGIACENRTPTCLKTDYSGSGESFRTVDRSGVPARS
jgi:DhnA family fructose-bisphosphate aldolase class Ia